LTALDRLPSRAEWSQGRELRELDSLVAALKTLTSTFTGVRWKRTGSRELTSRITESLQEMVENAVSDAAPGRVADVVVETLPYAGKWAKATARVALDGATVEQDFDCRLWRARDMLQISSIGHGRLIDAGENSAAELAESEPVEVNQLGVAIAGAGVFALVVSVFLPAYQSDQPTLLGIQDNTLIQNGDGWILLALALAVLVATYNSAAKHQRTWWPLVFGAFALAYAVYLGAHHPTLYRIGSDGTLDYSSPIGSTPGTAVYVAGVGGLLGVIGGRLMRGT
jgi:hypothetical protein